jgi:adenylate cyclase
VGDGRPTRQPRARREPLDPAVHGTRLVRRLRLRTTLLTVAASLVGAAMAIAYLSSLAPTPGCGDCERGFGWTITMSSLMFVVLGLLGLWLTRLAERRLRWLAEGREPSDKERRATLRYPGRVGLAVLAVWVIGAALSTTSGALEGADGRSLVRTGSTIVSVGLLVSTYVAFALERIGRPVFTRALEGDVVMPSRWLGLQPRLLLGWLVSSAVPLTTLLLLPFTTANDDRGDVGVTIFSLAVLGLVGGLAITGVAGRAMSAPLRDLRRAVRRIGEGDLEVTVPVNASGEVGHLQQGVNGMVAGLRERERLQTLLGHHVGVDVAQLVLDGDLGSEQRDVTALFIDVIGSTAMAEHLPAHDVVQRLNDVFAVVVRVVAAEGGLVNKFDGDGALCVFGAPTSQPDHATRGLRTARALRAEVEPLGHRHPGLDVGIGVASGTVVAGRIGASERYEYTVIGGPVNAAARLTDLAKGRASRVLAAASTVAEAAPEEAARWVPGGEVDLRGLGEPVPVAEPGPEPESGPESGPVAERVG